MRVSAFWKTNGPDACPFFAAIDDDHIKTFFGDGMKIIGFLEPDRVFEIKRAVFQSHIGDRLLFEAFGNEVVPLSIVLDGKDALDAAREKESRAAGAVFANSHVRLQKVLQEINCGVGEPWEFKVGGSFASEDIVSQAARHVLRVNTEVSNDAANFLRDCSLHSMFLFGFGQPLALGLRPIIRAAGFKRPICEEAGNHRERQFRGSRRETEDALGKVEFLEGAENPMPVMPGIERRHHERVSCEDVFSWMRRLSHAGLGGGRCRPRFPPRVPFRKGRGP